MNNFLYFLLLSEYLNFNELFKLMPLCKSSYNIFNHTFCINVHINPYKQKISDIIKFMRKNKEYQFNILKNINNQRRDRSSFYEQKRKII